MSAFLFQEKADAKKNFGISSNIFGSFFIFPFFPVISLRSGRTKERLFWTRIQEKVSTNAAYFERVQGKNFISSSKCFRKFFSFCFFKRNFRKETSLNEEICKVPTPFSRMSKHRCSRSQSGCKNRFFITYAPNIKGIFTWNMKTFRNTLIDKHVEHIFLNSNRKDNEKGHNILYMRPPAHIRGRQSHFRLKESRR